MHRLSLQEQKLVQHFILLFRLPLPSALMAVCVTCLSMLLSNLNRSMWGINDPYLPGTVCSVGIVSILIIISLYSAFAARLEMHRRSWFAIEERYVLEALKGSRERAEEFFSLSAAKRLRAIRTFYRVSGGNLTIWIGSVLLVPLFLILAIFIPGFLRNKAIRENQIQTIQALQADLVSAYESAGFQTHVDKPQDYYSSAYHITCTMPDSPEGCYAYLGVDAQGEISSVEYHILVPDTKKLSETFKIFNHAIPKMAAPMLAGNFTFKNPDLSSYTAVPEELQQRMSQAFLGENQVFTNVENGVSTTLYFIAESNSPGTIPYLYFSATCLE